MKKLFLISIIAIIFMSCTKHEQLASNLFAEGEYEKALLHFEAVLELDPRNEMMLYNAGRCYEEMKLYDKAIEKYDRSIYFKRDLTIAYLGRGRSYMKSGDYKSAVVDFGNTLYYDNKNQDALYLGALSYMKDSIYGKAQKAFSTLLEINPDHYKARFNRGVLYASQANTLFALSDFNNLIRNEKLLKNTYYNRGIIFQHMGNYASAIHDFSEAIDLGYKNEDILMKRASCYLITQQTEKACQDYKDLIKINEQEGRKLFKEYCEL